MEKENERNKRTTLLKVVVTGISFKKFKGEALMTVTSYS